MCAFMPASQNDPRRCDERQDHAKGVTDDDRRFFQSIAAGTHLSQSGLQLELERQKRSYDDLIAARNASYNEEGGK